MNHKQLSLISEKLTTFYEQEFNHFTHKSPIENQRDYADDISSFITDLTQELQSHNILLVENYIEPEQFDKCYKLDTQMTFYSTIYIPTTSWT